MMIDDVKVTNWTGKNRPDENELRQLMAAEGLRPYSWGNGPRDVYQAHAHGYHKVIYVVRGSIVFGLPEKNQEVSLQAGDRLDLPAGTVHDAVVGPAGVLCLEAHRH